MNIKIGILNVPKHGNKHDLIHFVTGRQVYVIFGDSINVYIRCRDNMVVRYTLYLVTASMSTYDTQITW